ncbi:MAG: hypothetical protein Tsb0026_00870 [Sulfuricaulis sp.]
MKEMNRTKLIITGLVLVLLSLPVVADKPAPPVAEADKFQSGTSAFDAGQYTKARELWLPLAENGDARAQHAIGRLYEKGRGVERDFAQAFIWYQKAAQKGHADSEYRLAVGYATGLGIKKNEGEALSWLRKAANNDHKRAQKTLARAYEEGRFGLTADPGQAKYWYDKANSGS